MEAKQVTPSKVSDFQWQKKFMFVFTKLEV